VGLVVTAQHTVEEYEALFKLAAGDLKLKKIYYWKNNEDSFEGFDGLLLRGDRNPNTKGLLKAAETARLQLVPLKDLAKDLSALKAVLVAGPEDQSVYADLTKVAESLNKVADVIWLTSCKNEAFQKFRFQIPLKSFVEKSGTFTNFKGVNQSIKKGPTIVREALDLVEFSESITDVLHGKSPRVAALASGTSLQAGGI
jgi:NADH-quinone oxidoreductase subunit G